VDTLAPVQRFLLDYDPMATDPGRWGHSLGNLAELWVPCLDAAQPETVVELGAYAGDVTRILLEWAGAAGARIFSVDPEPQDALVRLSEASPQLELVRATSHAALPTLPPADAYVIDGDHNYYTVSEELRLIAARAGRAMPLLICHDVCWPHARRDSYYTPQQIPAEHRQPIAEGCYLYPGVAGTHDGGLIYHYAASEEGGPRNGVLTALEDFLEGRDELRLAIVPAFFGLGLVWARDADYAAALEDLIGPWDRNPVLERLEANRALHLASREREAVRAAWCEEQSNRKDALLRKLVKSGTFAMAVALSRLRQRGGPAFTKDEVRALLPEYQPPS
jgi:hypothetical protein